MNEEPRSALVAWFHRWRYRVPQKTEFGYAETMQMAVDDFEKTVPRHRVRIARPSEAPSAPRRPVDLRGMNAVQLRELHEAGDLDFVYPADADDREQMNADFAEQIRAGTAIWLGNRLAVLDR